jgi:membrane-bound lytic murein transglycosylase D
MNKLIRYIHKASLTLSVMLLLFNKGIAQDSCNVAKGCNYDPIAAVLDSLVNQNFVQRLSFATAASQSSSNFQPLEIPVYKDEAYASRIAKLQSPIPLTYNQQVREYIDLYAVKKRALTERVMGLSNLYFPLYEEILDKNDLPLEFKYLSIVESALNPMAKSRVGATGLWQFMFQTGKLYNLKINSFIDERKDPIKSTEAACQYFKDMYGIYHDWLLVIAAYNCGAGNVNRAIVRSGGKTTFWEISRYLPKETRGYVPAFIAVTYLMNYTSEHNLTAVPPVISFFEADTVLVDKRAALKDIATATDVPYDLLAYLNPTYKKGIIPDADESYVLRLPVNKVNSYLANIDKIFSPNNTPSLAEEEGFLADPLNYIAKTVKVYHVVKRGEKLAAIADDYNCSVTDLKRWNKIKGKSVYKGQRLAIYSTIHQKIEPRGEVAKADTTSVKTDSTIAVNNDTKQESTEQQVPSVKAKKSSSLKNEKIVWHIVQPGDTLWNIAQRYTGVTVKDIKRMNNLKTNALKTGTRLKLKVNG